MAFELTTTAQFLSQETNIRQQIILEIEDIDLIFGAIQVTKLWRIGEDDVEIGRPGLVIGGTLEDPNSRPYISLPGTTNQITQQLEIDKGGIGSIQKFNVNLIDKDSELTRVFQPGNIVSDLLSREANVFLNFAGGAHPEDSIRIFNGIITSQKAAPGSWKIGIDHPEFLKRADAYEQINTNLDGAIGAGDTSIVVDNIVGYIPPGDSQRSFLQIDDELLEYTTIDSGTNTFSGITRGALGTTATSHDDDAQATSFYTLEGGAMELALKLMLSDGTGGPFQENEEATSFEFINAGLSVPNGILLRDRIKDDLGLELGDLVSVSGAVEAANNFSNAPILAFQNEAEGTVLILGGVDLVQETDSPALASFTSQYNTLPTGAGMKPSQVDVAQHVRLQEFFAFSNPDYFLYIKDTVSLKEFITDQIYHPQGFYQLPRKGRASVQATQPPLVLDDLVIIDQDNVKSADKNSINRQITKNFFNNVSYSFDQRETEDRFRAGEIFFSARSRNRINTGNKTLKIESVGLRDNPATRTFIRNQARRFSDRWQFAAESIDVSTNYKSSFSAEIGDIILFGSKELQIPDINSGTREFEPRLMEIIQKRMNIKTGDIRLTLLDTGFGLDGRFGTMSPNSFVDSSSTTLNIRLKPSFATGEFDSEREKWRNFIGQEIRIRSQDFTFSEDVRLIAFDPGTSNGLLIDPALSITPPEDYLVDLPEYNNAVDENQVRMKEIHNFAGTEILITAGVSSVEFEVAPSDISAFYVGAFIRVHDSDFSNNSSADTGADDAEITAIDTGTNRLTVNRDLGFIPSAGFIVDLIGFSGDEGLPYRYI